jgi:hypothetical protein
MRQYPNIAQAIGLLLLALLLQILLAIPIAALSMGMNKPLLENPLTIAVVNLVAIGLVLLLGLKKTQARFEEAFRFKPVRVVWLLPMMLTVVGMSILLSEADNGLRSILPMPSWIAKIFENLLNPQKNFWGSIFAAVIVAPLTEELLFRGLILRGFLSHYSTPKAIIVSALLFGFFHLNPWQFTGAVVLGAIFAWWFVKTRSLLPCIFGHALNNALPLVLLAVPQLQIPGYSAEPATRVEFQPLWFNLLGLVLAGAGLWLLARELRKIETNSSDEQSATYIAGQDNWGQNS